MQTSKLSAVLNPLARLGEIRMEVLPSRDPELWRRMGCRAVGRTSLDLRIM